MGPILGAMLARVTVLAPAGYAWRESPTGYQSSDASRDCVAVDSRNRPRHSSIASCAGCHAEHGVPTALSGGRTLSLERPSP